MKKLTEADDNNARKVFKEEIAKRYLEGYPSVVRFLTGHNYLQFLNEEEIDTILCSTNNILVKSQIALHFAKSNNFIKALELYYESKFLNKANKESLRPFAEVWSRLTDYYMEEGIDVDYINAIRAQKHVVELDPEYALGWENLGHFYRNNKNYQEAINAYIKALEKDPKSNSTLSHLALTYKFLGEHELAKNYAEQALRIEPKDQVAKRVMEEYQE